MKLKVMLVTVFAAGLGASFALANDGHGKGEGDHGKHRGRCTRVHVRGTIAPQALTVTVDRGSRKLNLAPGTAVTLQLGAAGQTVRVEAEACQVTVGSSTQLQVKSLVLVAKTPRTTTTGTTTTTTTGTTTTSTTGTTKTTTTGTTTTATTGTTTTTFTRRKHHH
jgi:hypothetical protein